VKKYYPIMLDISNKKCIIIGGGKVAYRKAFSLLEYGAEVAIISNILCDELAELVSQNKVEWISRDYKQGDLKGAFLAFAATNNKDINHKIFEEAQRANISINIIDNINLCDLIIPSKMTEGDLTIAISTNGKSPALAKKIRENIQGTYGKGYAGFIDLLGKYRIEAMEEIDNIDLRKNLYLELVNSDIIDYLINGRTELAEAKFNEIYDNYKIRGIKV